MTDNNHDRYETLVFIKSLSSCSRIIEHDKVKGYRFTSLDNNGKIIEEEMRRNGDDRYENLSSVGGGVFGFYEIIEVDRARGYRITTIDPQREIEEKRYSFREMERIEKEYNALKPTISMPSFILKKRAGVMR